MTRNARPRTTLPLSGKTHTDRICSVETAGLIAGWKLAYYDSGMSPAGGNHARRLRGRVASGNALRFDCTCGMAYDTDQEAIDEGWAGCPRCKKSTATLIQERVVIPDGSARP